MESKDTNNILSLLDNYTMDNADDKVKITEKRCHEIFDEVNDNIGDIKVYNP